MYRNSLPGPSYLSVISTSDGVTWSNSAGTNTSNLPVGGITPAIYNIPTTSTNFFLYGGYNLTSDAKQCINVYIKDGTALTTVSGAKNHIYCASVCLPNKYTLFGGGCTKALNG